MAIFKSRKFFSKEGLIRRFKSVVGRIVTLSIVAAGFVLIDTMAPEQMARAQTQAKPRLQAMSITDVDAERLNHLFTTPLKDLVGEEHQISDYRDKIVIVNFWASWCAPCVEEMPDLEGINRNFDKVQVIGYSVDTEQNIHRFLSKVPVDFPILIGEPTAISLMRKLGNPSGGLPFSLVFAPDHKLAYKIIGQLDVEELRAKLVEMGA